MQFFFKIDKIVDNIFITLFPILSNCDNIVDIFLFCHNIMDHIATGDCEGWSCTFPILPKPFYIIDHKNEEPLHVRMMPKLNLITFWKFHIYNTIAVCPLYFPHASCHPIHFETLRLYSHDISCNCCFLNILLYLIYYILVNKSNFLMKGTTLLV